MARRMSEINQKNGKYFKVPDLEKLTGAPWQVAQIDVTITAAFEGMYEATNQKPAEEGFFLQLAGIEKPLGVNWTNRCILQTMVGDVPWDTESLAGIRLHIAGHETGYGPGLVIGPVVDTMQASSSEARVQIDAAIEQRRLEGLRTPPPVLRAEPPPVDPRLQRYNQAPPLPPAAPVAPPAPPAGPTIPPAAVAPSPPAGPASWVDQSNGGSLPNEPAGYYDEDDPGAM